MVAVLDVRVVKISNLSSNKRSLSLNFDLEKFVKGFCPFSHHCPHQLHWPEIETAGMFEGRGECLQCSRNA